MSRSAPPAEAHPTAGGAHRAAPGDSGRDSACTSTKGAMGAEERPAGSTAISFQRGRGKKKEKKKSNQTSFSLEVNAEPRAKPGQEPGWTQPAAPHHVGKRCRAAALPTVGSTAATCPAPPTQLPRGRGSRSYQSLRLAERGRGADIPATINSPSAAPFPHLAFCRLRPV